MSKTGSKEHYVNEPGILSRGKYLELLVSIKLLDPAIIRSNDPEEVLTFRYEKLGNRFIIPWRKVKGKLRRLVMEQQRDLDIAPGCHLKDNLCMTCPACFLFGGTGETSTAKKKYNILSKVYGETFISATEVETIEPFTQNAVDEKTLTTGQALMNVVTVPPETEYLGVVTLKDPTENMTAILVDNLTRLSRIGARSVEWGKVKTRILGYRFGDREINSSYLYLGEDGPGQEKLTAAGFAPGTPDQLPVINEAYQQLAGKVVKLYEPLDEKKQDTQGKEKKKKGEK